MSSKVLVCLGLFFLLRSSPCSHNFRNIMWLHIPTAEEKGKVVDGFVGDLSSYTHSSSSVPVDGTVGLQLHPVVCCVCDGIPSGPNWSTWVSIPRLAKLCKSNNLFKSRVASFYPEGVVEGYTAKYSSEPDEMPVNALRPFILSPASQCNAQEEAILICKGCKDHMEVGEDRKKSLPQRFRKPPKNSIANGYLIGEPPEELTCLNQVELALVSRVRIYCQSWIFYGGCHQQIKGWHTFFKNRTAANVGNVEQLKLAGLKGIILVVLCGPFTTTQKALTLKQTAVNPDKVIAAYTWLKANNYGYADEEIPSADDIPVPHIITENVYVSYKIQFSFVNV